MAGTVHPIVVVCKRMRGRWNGGDWVQVLSTRSQLTPSHSWTPSFSFLHANTPGGNRAASAGV